METRTISRTVPFQGPLLPGGLDSRPGRAAHAATERQALDDALSRDDAALTTPAAGRSGRG